MDEQRYRQRCAEKTNIICSPLRQRRFQRYRIWVRGTAHTCVQWRSRCRCAVYLFSHQQGRWQDHGSWRVKGQSPRVADTHTHTPKHFISITNQTVSATCLRLCTKFSARGHCVLYLKYERFNNTTCPCKRFQTRFGTTDSTPRCSGPDIVKSLHTPGTPTDVFTSLTGWTLLEGVGVSDFVCFLTSRKCSNVEDPLNSTKDWVLRPEDFEGCMCVSSVAIFKCCPPTNSFSKLLIAPRQRQRETAKYNQYIIFLIFTYFRCS